MVLDSPARRRSILLMLWDLAYRQVEGPDSQGEPIDPGAVWERFNSLLGEIGLELTVVPVDGSEVIVPSDILDDLVPSPGR